MATFDERTIKLRGYIGKWVRHTPKAVRDGAPGDRLYAVVGVDDGVQSDGSRRLAPCLVAWKHKLLPNGRVKHPGYVKPMLVTDKRLFMTGRTKSGSYATAFFTMDSYYTLCDPK